MFTGAVVTHYGAEKIGCLVIPAGPGNSERQLLLMQDFPDHLHPISHPATGFIWQRSSRSTTLTRDATSPCARRFVGAEPYTEETRRKIEEGLGVDVYNSYGLSK